MKKYDWIVLPVLLFVCPILWRILFDEGEKIPMNTLDKNKKVW